MSYRKGFTLIELLIVIAILGILAAAVIVVLNPAQLLAQARDGTRFSDLDSIRSAIGLYLTDYAAPSLGAGPRASVSCTGIGLNGVCALNTIRLTDGTGWVGVKLDDISGGSPIPTLPTDPTNTATYQYAYDADTSAKTFELNARLESVKHRGKMTTDGGEDNICGANFDDATCWYEVGTAPLLSL